MTSEQVHEEIAKVQEAAKQVGQHIESLKQIPIDANATLEGTFAHNGLSIDVQVQANLYGVLGFYKGRLKRLQKREADLRMLLESVESI